MTLVGYYWYPGKIFYQNIIIQVHTNKKITHASLWAGLWFMVCLTTWILFKALLHNAMHAICECFKLHGHNKHVLQTMSKISYSTNIQKANFVLAQNSLCHQNWPGKVTYLTDIKLQLRNENTFRKMSFPAEIFQITVLTFLSHHEKFCD